jgi:UDP-N-acetylglucosamine acyltransferase
MIHRLAVIGDPPEHRDWNEACEMFYPVIHPTARVEALVTIDAGMLHPTRVGARSWLMKKVHVGHDAQIGEDCEIAPMTSVGGEVQIGDKVKVGQGAVFKPRVIVGDGAVIGAGAVVVKDVPAGETWVGNPAKSLVKKCDHCEHHCPSPDRCICNHGPWPSCGCIPT